MVISMLKIRRPLGRLIFNMGIAIPGKTVFLIETAPRFLVSPGHHRPWRWLCSLIKPLYSTKTDFNQLCHLSVGDEKCKHILCFLKNQENNTSQLFFGYCFDGTNSSCKGSSRDNECDTDTQSIKPVVIIRYGKWWTPTVYIYLR